jgi:hypothetical protein
MMRFRRNSLDQGPSQVSSPGRHGLTGLPRWAATAGVAAVIVLSLVGVAMASVLEGAATGSHATRPRVAGAAPGPATRPAAASTRGGSRSPSGRPSKAARRHAAGHTRARPKAQTRARPKVLRTSCRSVAHIGDSTSVDLVSPAYLPDPVQRLAARYADVGVRNFRVDASGGRSIVEEMPGQVNGYGVASAWRGQGYHGCWVIALGTNDTANVSVGSAVGLMARIQRMMSVARGEPVMWVNTLTQLSGGPWSNANEQAWNATLVRALARYPNMRIFNWAAVAQPGWFLPDGIHYNSFGCAQRARAIANALARAFPRSGHSRYRVVR